MSTSFIGLGTHGAGWLLTATVILAAAWAFVPEVPKVLAGICAWSAGLLLWPSVSRRTRSQFMALSALGIVAMAWGVSRGASPDFSLALAGNALLIAMLAAVSFLRLVTRVSSDPLEAIPKGRRAVWSSLLGVHLFGAVINLSVVFIMGDRLARDTRLSPRQFVVLSRGFSAAAFWSPFFAAMAAALTYAPGASLSRLILLGLPLAVLSILITVMGEHHRQDARFRGYPLHYSTLWLPALLAALVLGLHALQPHWPALGIICVAAPGLSLLHLLLSRSGQVQHLRRHIQRDLPQMGNELLLFLGAGVMAAGVHSVFQALGGWLPFQNFGGTEAALSLTFMYITSLVGVHPVINIAALGTLLAPLQADPNLLAVTFLCAWGIGVSASPFSGMNLALQGRYQLRGRDILRWNGPYSLVMLVLACAWLLTLEQLPTSLLRGQPAMPHAIQIHSLGDPEQLRWTQVEVPAPRAGEVRIHQSTIGLNFIDVYFRTGLYPAPGLPFIPGFEAAGIVEAVGAEVDGFRVGDRVAYAAGPLGAYTEVRNYPAERLIVLPDDIPERTAAAVLLKGMTAEYLLRRTYRVQAGDTILVHAAAGGVGQILCQWAAGLGAEVIGSVGSDAKAAIARARGCRHAVVYTREDIAERVMEITGGRGVPVVYDGVGQATFQASLACLRPRGMLVSFGQASGKVPPLDVTELSRRGSLYLTRPTLFDYVREREELLACAEALFEQLRENKVRVEIGNTYPLKDAARAHEDLEARRTSGSCLLLP